MLADDFNNLFHLLIKSTHLHLTENLNIIADKVALADAFSNVEPEQHLGAD